MIRLTYGLLRGITLTTPKDERTRPTKASMRESLFNILGQELYGKTFCDLCSGTGSIGVEAVSRGASSVVFVEKDFKAVDCLHENLQKIRSRIEGKCKVRLVKQDFRRYITSGFKFDLVYFDPPYEFYSKPGIFDQDFSQLLNPGGILIMEHSKHHPKDFPEEFSGLKRIREKKYGHSYLSFMMFKDEVHDEEGSEETL